ncbi:FMN-binding negative transcriptional regulator [Lysinibacillus parviboronicapiens]|uniref:FMN-binding negative transcriptional regulator n=1 Tax=Lysinibacillus parviboronicapiens TaxID=436516 RepID=UPI000D3C658F|nr:FMN-binding negative transcriptional regulator [Lysinibacillus parviboronicapiens]
MYIPAAFKIKDDSEMIEIIQVNSFATLFSTYEGMPYATHLPLIFDETQNCLIGHFAKGNPQWKNIEHQHVLAVFQGPHCYISPSWYETNQAVPTWNYVAVHVYGEIELIEKEEELVNSFNNMIAKYEGKGSPYSLSEVDAQLITNLNKGVQGFKINISRMEGKKKLSQNHSIDRQNLVIKHLEEVEQSNEQQIAHLMKQNMK